MFSGVLNELEPSRLAALLSCLVVESHGSSGGKDGKDGKGGKNGGKDRKDGKGGDRPQMCLNARQLLEAGRSV